MKSLRNDSIPQKSKSRKAKSKKFSNAPVEDLQRTLMKTVSDWSGSINYANQPEPSSSTDDENGMMLEMEVKQLEIYDTKENTSQPIEDDKLTITRSCLRTLTRKFGKELACENLNLDENSLPDFLIEEWSQSEEFQKQVLTSFFKSIGISVPDNPSKPTKSKSKKDNKTVELKGNLAYVMAEEKAIKESIQEQKYKLEDESNFYNLEALKDEYTNYGLEVITDTFVRNDFDYELTRACLATSIIDCHQFELHSKENSCLALDYWPKTSMTDDVTLNNPLELIPVSGERFTLKEITDYENAVKNSLLDLDRDSKSFASSISIDRLHERFPQISKAHLKLLFLKCNFSEQNVTNWLKTNGISHENVSDKLEITSRNQDTNSPSPSQDYGPICFRPSQQEMFDLDRAIIEIRAKLDYLNKIRSSIMQSKKTIASFDYYTREIASQMDRLEVLLEQQAYALTTQRSLNNMTTSEVASRDQNFASCWSTIDLHGLTWSCALKVLKSRLSQLRSMKAQGKYPKYLNVVTGKGLNSPSGQAIIKNNLIQFLKQREESFSLQRENTGVILIKI